MGHPDNEEAVEFNQIIDIADDAVLISQDGDGDSLEVDLKTGEVTGEDHQ